MAQIAASIPLGRLGEPAELGALIAFPGERSRRLLTGHDRSPGRRQEPGIVKRLGIALSGGGARGAAHTGVLARAVARGLSVHCIAGCSSGAIVGAFHAAGVDAERQLEFAQRLRWRSLRMLGIPKMGFFHSGELERFLIETIGDIHFGALTIPLAVVATDSAPRRPSSSARGASRPPWRPARPSRSCFPRCVSVK